MNKALSVSLADHVPSLVQLLSQALRRQGINIVATVICVRCLRQLAVWLIQKVGGYQYCRPSCLRPEIAFAVLKVRKRQELIVAPIWKRCQ